MNMPEQTRRNAQLFAESLRKAADPAHRQWVESVKSRIAGGRTDDLDAALDHDGIDDLVRGR